MKAMRPMAFQPVRSGRNVRRMARPSWRRSSASPVDLRLETEVNPCRKEQHSADDQDDAERFVRV